MSSSACRRSSPVAAALLRVRHRHRRATPASCGGLAFAGIGVAVVVRRAWRRPASATRRRSRVTRSARGCNVRRAGRRRSSRTTSSRPPPTPSARRRPRWPTAHERVGGPLAAGAAFVPDRRPAPLGRRRHERRRVRPARRPSPRRSTRSTSTRCGPSTAASTSTPLAALEGPLTRVARGARRRCSRRPTTRGRRGSSTGPPTSSTTSTRASTSTCPASTTRSTPSGWRRRCSVPTGRGPTSCCSRRRRSRAGLGGFVGNYGELTVDDGLMALSGFGRAEDFDAAAAAAGVRLDGPEGFLAPVRPVRLRHRRQRAGRRTRRCATWRCRPTSRGSARWPATSTPRRRAVRSTASSPWIPYVVAALLRYTGPIQLRHARPGAERRQRRPVPAARPVRRRPRTRTSASTPSPRRRRSRSTPCSAARCPSRSRIARDLGPLAAERRLLVWSADPEEQALLERVHLAGQIPPLDGADGWSFTVTNGGGNKIDSFLERAAGYDVDDRSGHRRDDGDAARAADEHRARPRASRRT